MSIRPAENSTLDIRHVIGIGTPKAVDLWLDVVTELPDRARELGSLSKAELGKLGPLLDGTNAVELFESIDDKLAAEALHAMDPSLAATFLEALDSDHAANILREFKEPKREALLTLLPLERAMVLRGLLATGQVRFRDVPAVLAKELSTGVLVGLTMAAAAVVRAWTLGVGPQVTLTVALTVAAIVVWSSLVAAVLPPLLKKLRIDPAIVSGPMIATIVDGTGLLIYFLVAHLTLTELHGL